MFARRGQHTQRRPFAFAQRLGSTNSVVFFVTLQRYHTLVQQYYNTRWLHETWSSLQGTQSSGEDAPALGWEWLEGHATHVEEFIAPSSME